MNDRFARWDILTSSWIAQYQSCYTAVILPGFQRRWILIIEFYLEDHSGTTIIVWHYGIYFHRQKIGKAYLASYFIVSHDSTPHHSATDNAECAYTFILAVCCACYRETVFCVQMIRNRRPWKKIDQPVWYHTACLHHYVQCLEISEGESTPDDYKTWENDPGY